jgi:hypothetical protein
LEPLNTSNAFMEPCRIQKLHKPELVNCDSRMYLYKYPITFYISQTIYDTTSFYLLNVQIVNSVNSNFNRHIKLYNFLDQLFLIPFNNIKSPEFFNPRSLKFVMVALKSIFGQRLVHCPLPFISLLSPQAKFMRGGILFPSLGLLQHNTTCSVLSSSGIQLIIIIIISPNS